MGIDVQVGAVMEQTIQYVGGFVGCRGDDADMVRTVLVRDMGIKAEAGVAAIPGVHLAGNVAAFAGAEELAVR